MVAFPIVRASTLCMARLRNVAAQPPLAIEITGTRNRSGDQSMIATALI
jgi:hypothetical protein